MGGEMVCAILFGVWLLATGLVYRTTVKREYDSYGVPDWNKKQ